MTHKELNHDISFLNDSDSKLSDDLSKDFKKSKSDDGDKSSAQKSNSDQKFDGFENMEPSENSELAAFKSDQKADQDK